MVTPEIKAALAQVEQNLQATIARKRSQMRVVVEYTMAEAESFAKLHAPWQDRTGNARGTIFGIQFDEPGAIVGRLGIKVFYGKYLEVYNQGKFRIIKPTMEIYREKVKDRIRSI